MLRTPSIGTDPDYKRAPAIPDPVELEGWVQAYRDGAGGYQNLLIKSHLHLVMSIVRRYRKRHNYQDLEGAALLALTEAVVSAQTALEDNAITPYIATCVRHRIKDAIASDRIVAMPPRTFRYKAAKGEIKPSDNIDPTVIGVISTPVSVGSDTLTFDTDTRAIYNVPEARPIGPSLEFTEALNLAIRTDQERCVIDLRAKGFEYADFESVMGLKKSRIGEIVHNVERRFNLLYA